MAQSERVLDLSGVTVRRGGNQLLDGIDWQVDAAQRWVVLGPNGAGKTTLLNLAAARNHPTSGVVEILGERLGRVDVFELRPRIGLTTTQVADAIPNDEQAFDVVRTAAWGMMGRWREEYDPQDDERAASLMRWLGVAQLAERRFGTLSEGERKRVLIARALMTDPELLLLDEPAAGLDLGAREALVATLAGLARDEAAPALVLVTHHVEEIPPGFTHALVLSAGGVIAAGPIAEALTSETLSKAFGLPLTLTANGDRFTATAS
ncbi:ABC transporter ATP-binding protein [Glycomyces tritici]|uniref:ABC transporter ATP-binding protein n=1 Tax=Glycomyces tritici TaxID=2665176 RepID=A0ABT7YIJ1_9ACTN|nr:ABC transporter ATP-binding protein [Glycomyces tritici]MDN3238452.1 ABC transporter ATP-binding protein [Glycomyces tritici]